MRVTRKDVALLAGGSEASVSYVMNKSRSVSPETSKKVWDAVKELNYTADMVARSMVKNETRQLAVLANDLSNPYFAEIITGFENAAIDNNYLVSICTAQRETEKYIQRLIAQRIDGVFITGIPYMSDDRYREIILSMVDAGIRVLINGIILKDCQDISHIFVDHMIGIDKTVAYLKNMGHTQIAMVSTLGRNSTFDTRDQMFFSAMKKYLPDSPQIFVSEMSIRNPDMDSSYRLTKKLLADHPEVTAVLCLNDLMAYGVIQAATELNKSVPNELSVVGMDDIYISKKFNPTVTSIGFDKREYGKLAFDVLYRHIKENVVENIDIRTELFVRNSTGLAPGMK